jgi:hypothetical protein
MEIIPIVSEFFKPDPLESRLYNWNQLEYSKHPEIFLSTLIF